MALAKNQAQGAITAALTAQQEHHWFTKECDGLQMLTACVLSVCRRGKWLAAHADSDFWEVVSAADWRHLLEMYGSDGDVR